MEGYIYIIDELITESDIITHPNTTMEPGEEWLTQREMQLKMISNTKITPSEILCEKEIGMFLKNNRQTSKMKRKAWNINFNWFC
ncbi:hypothetical protein KHA93_01330 [Bacillus sp. FJAT-49732]|uniref:Uncharacterized protein n=1 Tax=Lederbergia citrisecunda TaxID=2833583 RepID=A0A942TKA2_9BACI|nr:hypothetical protein [Lederbergia citrisecunda]MBS4198301.1 hypothetical protein [Lederbergia citrisecunda]